MPSTHFCQDTARVIDSSASYAVDRRSLLITAGTAIFGRCVGVGRPPIYDTPGSEVNIGHNLLRLMLNMKYIQATFYSYAIYGRGLDQNDTTGNGRHGAVIACAPVHFQASLVASFACELSTCKLGQLRHLRHVLGSNTAAQPDINLRPKVASLAASVGLVLPGAAFDPFLNNQNFLVGALLIEQLGRGALPSLAGQFDADCWGGVSAILRSDALYFGRLKSMLDDAGLQQSAASISALIPTVFWSA